EVIAWLELEPYNFHIASDQNSSYQVRNSWLHYQVTQLTRFLPKSKLYKSLKQLYFSSPQTTEKTHKSAADIEAIKRLNQYFKPYNQQLENLVDLDIQHWMK
ncbi:MAG: hypothetical protein AAF599_19400, partial [Bacteroidota bacterium]